MPSACECRALVTQAVTRFTLAETESSAPWPKALLGTCRCDGAHSSARCIAMHEMDLDPSGWLLQRLLRPGFSTASLQNSPAALEVVRELAAIVAGAEVRKSKRCQMRPLAAAW